MDTSTVGVSMRVVGIDLDSSETGEVLATQFPSAIWEEHDGLTVMTISVSSDNPVDEALQMARRLEGHVKGCKVDSVDRDLVTATDIAMRVDLSREAVRKWTSRSNFPAPHAVVGKDSMKIWAWTQVVEWLLNVRGIDMDENLLTIKQMTQLENCLMANPDHTTVQWKAITKTSTSPKIDLVFSPTTAVARQSAFVGMSAGRGHGTTVTDRPALVGASREQR